METLIIRVSTAASVPSAKAVVIRTSVGSLCQSLSLATSLRWSPILRVVILSSTFSFRLSLTISACHVLQTIGDHNAVLNAQHFLLLSVMSSRKLF